MITTTQTDIEKRDEIFKDKEDIQYHITTILQRADYQRKVKKHITYEKWQVLYVLMQERNVSL